MIFPTLTNRLVEELMAHATKRRFLYSPR